eukprot:GHVL01044269.1.p1 GENE.GHVL01044269.1~~GHVL01044269.1.p1  ORF type:complete len:1058 (-),score=202.05 GHVL01044269.1:528-3251(-)
MVSVTSSQQSLISENSFFGGNKVIIAEERSKQIIPKGDIKQSMDSESPSNRLCNLQNKRHNLLKILQQDTHELKWDGPLQQLHSVLVTVLLDFDNRLRQMESITMNVPTAVLDDFEDIKNKAVQNSDILKRSATMVQTLPNLCGGENSIAFCLKNLMDMRSQLQQSKRTECEQQWRLQDALNLYANNKASLSDLIKIIIEQVTLETAHSGGGPVNRLAAALTTTMSEIETTERKLQNAQQTKSVYASTRSQTVNTPVSRNLETTPRTKTPHTDTREESIPQAIHRQCAITDSVRRVWPSNNYSYEGSLTARNAARQGTPPCTPSPLVNRIASNALPRRKLGDLCSDTKVSTPMKLKLGDGKLKRMSTGMQPLNTTRAILARPQESTEQRILTLHKRMEPQLERFKKVQSMIEELAYRTVVRTEKAAESSNTNWNNMQHRVGDSEDEAEEVAARSTLLAGFQHFLNNRNSPSIEASSYIPCETCSSDENADSLMPPPPPGCGATRLDYEETSSVISSACDSKYTADNWAAAGVHSCSPLDTPTFGGSRRNSFESSSSAGFVNNIDGMMPKIDSGSSNMNTRLPEIEKSQTAPGMPLNVGMGSTNKDFLSSGSGSSPKMSSMFRATSSKTSETPDRNSSSSASSFFAGSYSSTMLFGSNQSVEKCGIGGSTMTQLFGSMATDDKSRNIDSSQYKPSSSRGSLFEASSSGRLFGNESNSGGVFGSSLDHDSITNMSTGEQIASARALGHNEMNQKKDMTLEKHDHTSSTDTNSSSIAANSLVNGIVTQSLFGMSSSTSAELFSNSGLSNWAGGLSDNGFGGSNMTQPFGASNSVAGATDSGVSGGGLLGLIGSTKSEYTFNAHQSSVSQVAIFLQQCFSLTFRASLGLVKIQISNILNHLEKAVLCLAPL